MSAETLLVSPRVPEVVDTSEHQLLPRLPLQGSSHISAPYTQVPVTITPVDTPTLDPPSELSEIEPEEESGSLRPKSSVPKGKRKVTGRSSEGGPSKRRGGWKKGGNNA